MTKNNGTTTTYHLRMESSNLEYAVVRFDLSALAAGAQIQSATAHFYVKATKGHPEGPVNVHRVTADWTETGATWETMSSNFDSTVLSMVPPQPAAGDNWVQLNLTAQVQAWVNGEPNYGIMLVPIGEGTHAEYISREGAGSQQPRLDVVVGTGPATPVTIAATGTLDSGLTRTLTRMVGANQPPGNMFLQLGADAGEDTLLDSFYDLRNYGGADYMQVHDNGTDWQQYPLIRFDLARLPRGAAVRSARLELSLMSVNTPGTATIHQVTRSWVEGTKVGGGTADGATWFTHDGTNPWTSAGGDINTPVVDETAINGSETWVSWEIAPLVERWLAGEPNYGLLIKPDSALDEARFASKENSNFDVQPKLTITYACECGSACLAPQGSGNVLIVVINPTTLVPLDAHKKALFESWGYTVSVVGESANQASYDSAIAAADVVFISETVNANQVGTKLQDVTIGVISQDGSYNSALGLAAGSAWPVASAINVTDASHYITAPFPTGPLEIYAAAMEQLTVSGSEAPGLQTLADSGGAGALVVLDAGAMGTGGTPLAGRRVMLPLGRDNSFNWGYLNNDGRLLVQRALAWGMRADVTSAGNLLLVVGDPGNLTSQESAKKALMESWKFTVNLIDESDSQANFDTAIAANDVAYIPQDINATNLGTKLANAPIGVVNEEGEQVDELDFSGGILFKTNHAIDVVDNTHYITQPFATGFLTFTSSDQSVHMLSGQIAPGLQTLGQTLNTGTQYKPSLATLDVGDTLSSGGSAVGRRVQLPWGGGTFDINLLTDDGRTIMRRAIEWGAGAGSAPSYAVLLVVGDATTLSSKDAGRKTLIESWGHTVTLIDDGDTQANFDAAAASTDVVFVTASIGGGTLGNKLTGSSAPIVNEFNGKLDNFGFSSGTSTFALADAFTKTDALHYITEPFSGNPVTVFSGSLSMPVPSGTLAPDLANAGELTGIPALVTLDTGATRYDGNPAPARRAHLPFGPAETTDLTADGETILQRALEWAAGASSGATPQQILLVVADASSLTAQDLARKTLMEGWGYGVKTISASDSQANFDAAVATADAAYVAEQQQSTALGTKL
ncbi:MAG: DNRLRE domain-containing protein, partial [Thiogranum sp.]